MRHDCAGAGSAAFEPQQKAATLAKVVIRPARNAFQSYRRARQTALGGITARAGKPRAGVTLWQK